MWPLMRRARALASLTFQCLIRGLVERSKATTGNVRGFLSLNGRAFQDHDGILQIRDHFLEACDCFLESGDIGEKIGLQES